MWWDWKAGAKDFPRCRSLATAASPASSSPPPPTCPGFAPDLSQSDWANLGQLYWRVAAQDTQGTQGTWSTVQPLSLATKLVVSTSATTMPKQTTKTITVTVKNAQGQLSAVPR